MDGLQRHLWESESGEVGSAVLIRGGLCCAVLCCACGAGASLWVTGLEGGRVEEKQHKKQEEDDDDGRRRDIIELKRREV